MADPTKTAPATTPEETAASTPPANPSENPTGSENPNNPNTPVESKPAEPETPVAPTEEPPDPLELAKGEGEKQAEAEAKAKADFDAYVKAAGFENGVADAVLKKGENGEADETMPAAEVGAVLTALQATGVPADKAGPTIAVIGALDRIRAERAAKDEQDYLRELRTETAKEFGDNLAAAARDMVAGGTALFGAELWKDITERATPLCNDKRFVRALASYGARLRNDNGGPAPASGGASAPGGKLVFDLASFGKGTIN